MYEVELVVAGEPSALHRVTAYVSALSCSPEVALQE
jgi:hypothetical protein